MRTLEQEDAIDRWQRYHDEQVRRSNRFIIGWAVTSAVLAAVITYMVIR